MTEKGRDKKNNSTEKMHCSSLERDNYDSEQNKLYDIHETERERERERFKTR